MNSQQQIVYKFSFDKTRTFYRELCKLKGIGVLSAQSIIRKINQPILSKLSQFNTESLEKLAIILEEIDLNNKLDTSDIYLNDKSKAKIFSGENWTRKVLLDIHQLKKLKGYKGRRHTYGLRVNGQKTRTTGRKNSRKKMRKKK